MKKLLFNLLFIGMAYILSGQTQFNVLGNLVDFDKFNSTLKQNNYPEFKEEVLNYALIFTTFDEGKSLGNRVGFIYSDFRSEEFEIDASINRYNDINWRGVGFLSGTDFRIINKKWITFGPSLDLIIMQQRLRFIKELPTNGSFANLISSDTEIDTYRNVRFMFDGRVNLLFKFGPKTGKTRYGLGLTGGYRLDPFKPTWKYEKSLDVDIPGTKQNGLLLGLMFTIKMPGIAPQKPKLNEKKS